MTGNEPINKDEMKKKVSYIVLLLLAAVSCHERHPVPFEDICGVYFNNTSASMTLTDTLDLTFVYESGSVLEVPVKVQLLGRTGQQDRPLDITVSSDNAVADVDFSLPERVVMPAGASAVDYIVTLHRTSALKNETKSLTLSLHPNEYFDLPVTEAVSSSDTVSTLQLTICFSDMFTKAPATWEENLVGKFSQQKFELVCKVLGIDPGDFNDAGVITLAKLLYISTEMTAYVNQQVQNRDAGQEYDADAFDPVTGEPLIFR